MIKDVSVILKELENYEEIEMPYNFNSNCHIKYITILKNGEESFFKGGKYVSRMNDDLLLDNGTKIWRVPIYLRDKEGEIIYKSRLFCKNSESICVDKDSKEEIEKLNKVVEYQQSIINKLSERLKLLEIQKNELQLHKKDYEELLEQNRHNLKKLSLELNEKNEHIKLLLNGNNM